MGTDTKQLSLFKLEEEHEDDVFDVFSEVEIKEQLPELFLQLSPFKPNKPGPKAKFREQTIMENSFGSVVLTGTELTIFDEDVLLAIISTKKQIVGNDFYFVTSYREVAKLMGITWRGAKFDENKKLKGNSTPKQIQDSVKRLWMAGLSFNSYSAQRGYNFRFIESYSNPLLDENQNLHYKQGVKDQLQVRISKEFLYMYHLYKKYTIKLEDRKIINNLIGKALYRYMRYLTTFKHSGIHSEGLKKLITKINWDLPKKSKDSDYTDWREVRRQLEQARIGLEKIGIICEIPEDLNIESIIIFKNNRYHQANLLD